MILKRRILKWISRVGLVESENPMNNRCHDIFFLIKRTSFDNSLEVEVVEETNWLILPLYKRQSFTLQLVKRRWLENLEKLGRGVPGGESPDMTVPDLTPES